MENKQNPTKHLGQYAVTGGPGRPPGSKNKFTQLKETIIDTLEKLDAECGGEAKNWLFELARREPRLFVSLLVKVIPAATEVDMNLNANVKADVVSMANMTPEQRRSRLLELIHNLGGRIGKN